MVFALIGLVALFTLYIHNLATNPPGFSLDESSIAYNAYTISQSGRDEHGEFLPLYFRAFGEYKNPTYIYLLSLIFKITGPGNLVARYLSASLMFLSALVMGLLAWRISGRQSAGLIIGFTALVMPWLFEIGRLVFEVALYPLVLGLFLLALYRAHSRAIWALGDVTRLAAALALLTYTYSIGRLLAPLLALGLIFFLTRKNYSKIITTWMIYGVTLIPLLVFNARHPGVLTRRFYAFSYIGPQSQIVDIVGDFIIHFVSNLDFSRWVLTGDPILRHHIGGTGSLLIAALLLAITGCGLIIARERNNPWWRFILYGTVISLVPASLMDDVLHSLRLIGFPVFLLILMIPAVQFLVEKGEKKIIWQMVLTTLLALTLVQAAHFQIRFHRDGVRRIKDFDADYPEVFKAAIALPDRPIYLLDSPHNSYIQAYWNGALRGIGTDAFIRLETEQFPPPGVLVIGAPLNDQIDRMILERTDFSAYYTLK